MGEKAAPATIGNIAEKRQQAIAEFYDTALDEGTKKFSPEIAISSEISGWNWGAFFLGPVWLFIYGRYSFASLHMTAATFFGKAILTGGSQTHVE